MTNEKLMKLSSVADKLDLSVRTVQKYVREGALPVVRVGPYRLLRVRSEDFEKFSKEKT